MRFWDASALVPLCLEQPMTPVAVRHYEADPEMAVWWATPVECASAFARLRRAGVLDEREEARALEILRALGEAWHEVLPGGALREVALRLLRVHPLRAADALQLAAALEWSGAPGTGELVTFDERLGRAARLEGYAALGGDG